MKHFIFLLLFFTQLSLAAKQEFHMRLETEPPTLDWNLAADFVSIGVLFHLMEGLAEYDENNRAVPSLATWKISADGKTYTYTLKPGMKWSDGTPLRAQDFWDSWERSLNPSTGSGYAYFFYDILNAKEYNEGKIKDATQLGFKVINDSTFEVKLKKPAAYFVNIPAFTVTFPIRKDLISKYGRNWTNPEHMTVTGPFQLKEWKHDEKIEMIPNQNYRGIKAKLEKVVAYVIGEDTTAINMFETGKIHYLSRLPGIDMDRLKKNPGYKSLPYLREYYYGFNTSKPPFNDPRVRQAFSLAINRAEITSLLKGNQIPTTSWIPKGMLAHNPSIGLSYNPQKAKKLLADAGFPEGKEFPPTTFMFDTRDDNKIIAERLLAQWEKVLGVKLNTQSEDWKIYLSRLRKDSPAIFRHGWGADFPDPDNFMNMFTSYSGNNFTSWKNKKYDELIEKAAAEKSEARRKNLYNQAQKMLLEDEAVIAPLFNESINMLVSPKVRGIQINSLGLLKIHRVEMIN